MDFSNPLKKIFKKRDPNQVDKNGFTLLQYAVLNNDIEKIRKLLEEGANPNLRGKLVEAPVHMAINNGRFAAALTLAEGGADLNTLDAKKQAPLHVAAKRGQESLILSLLKLGANPNITNGDGDTPLHVLSSGCLSSVTSLIKHGANVNARNILGDTPLHKFVNYPGMVEKLLAQGADPNAKNNVDFSPFALMVDDKYLPRYKVELWQSLLPQVDLATLSPRGETVLHLAARLELKTIYSEVVDKASLDIKDADGRTVLHHLAQNRNADMIAETLGYAPQLIGDKDNQGLTPMETFLRNVPAPSAWQTKEPPKDWTGVAEMLLAAKADPDSTDAKGHTLLYYAVIQKKYDFLEKAMQMKANPDIPDETGRSPLQYAIERKDMDAMDILLDRGANPDLPDARGWTVLDRLAQTGDRTSPVVQRLIVAGGQYEKMLPLDREQIREPKPAPKTAKPRVATKTPRR